MLTVRKGFAIDRLYRPWHCHETERAAILRCQTVKPNSFLLLVVTGATLVVTGALLVVTRSY